MIVEEFVQSKYYTDLAGLGLQVYSSGAVPEDVSYPYVLIGDIQVIQRKNPCLLWTAFVTVDIVTGSLSPIGRSNVFDLAEQVEGVLNTPTQYTANGYTLYNTYLQNSNQLEERGTFGYIYRNLRTYQHEIGTN